jgi:hypothetical protein
VLDRLIQILAVKVRVGVRISYARFHAGVNCALRRLPNTANAGGLQSVITFHFVPKDSRPTLQALDRGMESDRLSSQNVCDSQHALASKESSPAQRRDDCVRPLTLLNHSNSPKLARKRQGALVCVDDSLVGLTGAPPKFEGTWRNLLRNF